MQTKCKACGRETVFNVLEMRRLRRLQDVYKRQGKGAGYARWAKVFNLKQMAKAMMFMEVHGIKSYAELKEKADGISEKSDALLESVKADEARMSEVSVLRKHLINYACLLYTSNFSYAVVDGDVYFRENSIMRKADLSATATGRIKGMRCV